MAMHQGRMLTAGQLVAYRTKTEKILPIVGSKEFTPSHSWLEKKQIQSALDERKNLLEEERVEKLGSLSTAEWKEELKLACVTRRVGRHFEVLGHEQDATLSLYPEEALYLLETNCLELLYGGVAMSVQQGYNTLLGTHSDCSLNEYRVFSHLLRQGYRLLRHSPAVRVTRYERQIGLHHHTLGCKQKNARLKHAVGNRAEIKSETNIDLKSKDVCIKEEVVNIDQDIIELDLVQVNEVQIKKERKRKRSCRSASVSKDTNVDIKMEIEVLDVCNTANSSLQSHKSSTSEVEIIEDSYCNIVSHLATTVSMPSKNTEIEEIQLSDNEHSDEYHLHIPRNVTDSTAGNVSSRHDPCIDHKADEETNIYTICRQIMSELVGSVCLSGKSIGEEPILSALKEEKFESEHITGVEIKKEDDDFYIIQDQKQTSGSQLTGQNTVESSEITVSNDASVLCNQSVHISANVGNDSVNNIQSCKGVVKEEPELMLISHSSTFRDTRASPVVRKTVDNNLQDLHGRTSKNILYTQDIFDISDNSISSVSEVKIELQTNNDSMYGCDGSSVTNVKINRVKRNYSPQPCSSSWSVNAEEIGDRPLEAQISSFGKRNIKSEDQPLEVIDIIEDESTDLTNVTSEIRPSKKLQNSAVRHKCSSDAAGLKEIKPLHCKSKKGAVKVEEGSSVNKIINHKVIDISDDRVKEEMPSDIKMEEELSKFYEEIELIDVEDKEEMTEVVDKKTILDSFPNISGLFVANLTVPLPQYLPPNVCPEKKEYNIQLWRLKARGLGGGPELREDSYNERTVNSHRHNNYQSNRGYHRPKHSRKHRGYRNTFASTWSGGSRSPHLPWENSGPLMNTYHHPPPSTIGFQTHSIVMYPTMNHMGQFPIVPAMPFPVPSHIVQQSWPSMQPSSWLDGQQNQLQPHVNNIFEPQMYRPSRDKRTDRHNDTIPLRREGENEYSSRFAVNEAQAEVYEYNHTRHSKLEETNSGDHPRANNHRYYCPPPKLKKLMQHVHTAETVEVPKEINVQLSLASVQTGSWTSLKQQLNNNVQTPETSQVIRKVEASDVVVEDCVEMLEECEDMAGEVKEELDTEELTPLLKPADCTSIGNILNKLQIIKSAHFVNSEVVLEEPNTIINYDLYLPNTPFRKSNPPLPDYRLSIVGYEEPMPSPGRITAVLKDYEDGVPLLLAVDLPDSVAFFHYSTVDLPTYSDNVQK